MTTNKKKKNIMAQSKSNNTATISAIISHHSSHTPTGRPGEKPHRDRTRRKHTLTDRCRWGNRDTGRNRRLRRCPAGRGAWRWSSPSRSVLGRRRNTVNGMRRWICGISWIVGLVSIISLYGYMVWVVILAVDAISLSLSLA